MSLRTRFAVITAGMVFVLATSLSIGAFTIASAQMQKPIDRSLRQRAVRLVQLVDRPNFDVGSMFHLQLRDEILSTELDAITQINMPGMRPMGRMGNSLLPTNPEDEKLMSSGHGIAFSGLTLDGVHYRVLTVAMPNGTLIKVAKDTKIIDDSRNGMRTWFPIMAMFAVIVAAIVGWLFARRVSKPIEQLAITAEHIAVTQDLSQEIQINGKDEVAQLATSFNTMLQALRKSVDKQRQLVQDASHELRTPLTSLRANTELLERAVLTDEDRTAILADMRTEVDELVALSLELSALASQQRNEENLSTVDLYEVAFGVAARAGRRSSIVINVFATDGTEVLARPQQLERAISNLVDNALKFANNDSPIEIHVGALRIEVRDHGPGIADSDKPQIFDRFYRATATRSMPGSGLGLAIVNQFAQDHDATAYVLDNVGGGAIVGIQFR